MLAEEAGEIVQACCKVLRHGWESTHPEGSETNRTYLEREIKDLFAVIGIMVKLADLTMDPSDEEMDAILARKLKYTHSQGR